jgi:preprotein translocase subunit Sec63
LETTDYYKILELPPSATLREIKSAYRRLAHQYHPDKNNSDRYAAAQFEMIKEAYEVLSNPSKKANYLQQRWYDQVMNRKQSDVVVTPVSILKQLLLADQHVSKLDVYRMDKESLFNELCSVLSDASIEKINEFNETAINISIVDTVLRICRVLPLTYVQPISVMLLKIKTDPATSGKIRQYVFRAKRAEAWNKYETWLVLGLAVLICILIYVISS